jgi:hypothetical protein
MKIYWIVLLLVISVGCSSSDKEVDVTSDEEKFPDVDMKRFEKVKVDGVEVLMLKALTSATGKSDRVLLDYNHLAFEQHVKIERIAIANYKKSLKARDKSINNSFEAFTIETLKDFQGTQKHSEEAKFESSVVNELSCRRVSFEAQSYGFPKSKTYWIRYFKGKKFYYTMICWTVSDRKSKFEKEALAMGLSFKL